MQGVDEVAFSIGRFGRVKSFPKRLLIKADWRKQMKKIIILLLLTSSCVVEQREPACFNVLPQYVESCNARVRAQTQYREQQAAKPNIAAWPLYKRPNLPIKREVIDNPYQEQAPTPPAPVEVKPDDCEKDLADTQTTFSFVQKVPNVYEQ